MTQVFIFGSSSAYGVGAERAGWGDLLKEHLHNGMYSPNGVGEKYELYNFAQPGATIQFVIATMKDQLRFYRRSGKVIAVLNVGGNNSKARGAPDKFVSTLEEYEQLMSQLLEQTKEAADEVIVVANNTVNEAKTNPKPNPLADGEPDYFTNDRRIMFNHALRKLCDKYQVHFVDADISPDEWMEKYQYIDGLHPNQAGHQYISEKVAKAVDELL